jgi:4-hydroxy-3-methylbut-2-enyl diphosphate reductase
MDSAEPIRTDEASLEVFRSDVIDRLRQSDPPNLWTLPGGQIRLPRVFGFCRGVKRALAMADRAVRSHAERAESGRLILLGEIIHNPWVNEYFRQRGVELLTRRQRQVDLLGGHVGPGDTAIIPAFGVPLPIERKLRDIGCAIIDCSCGDVIRVWRWSEHAAADGFGVLVFGRSQHDETVVTKSRIAEKGGAFLVLENLDQVRTFAAMVAEPARAESFAEHFGPNVTNAETIEPMLRLAQVSQTTMLYDDTQQVQQIVQSAFADRFGGGPAEDRLRIQPTVCRATQDRQNAAVELCRSDCDAVIVVGGFGSSNTRHLLELARQYAPAWLIEDATAIVCDSELEAFDPTTQAVATVRNWLPDQPCRLGVLAGASSPEIVVGLVVRRLGEFLGARP